MKKQTDTVYTAVYTADQSFQDGSTAQQQGVRFWQKTLGLAQLCLQIDCMSSVKQC